MPPRATVQQAIELLKIHQIRRENVAIYQQLQTYRDEIADLKDAHDQLRTSIESNHTETKVLQNAASETIQRLNQADRKLELATRDRTALHVELKSLQTRQIDLSKHLEEKCADHVSDIRAVETKVQEIKDKTNLQFKTWTEELTQMQGQLIEAAERRSLQLLKNQQDITQRRAIVTQDKASGHDCVTQVDGIIQDRDHLRADNAVQYLPDTNLTSTTEDLNSDLLLTLQPRDRPRESTVPEDVDLDDAANDISYAGHGQPVVSHHDSFVMLPYQTTNEFPSIDEVVSLAQSPHETLVEYFDRGQDVLTRFPKGSESVIIRRWVDGLADKHHQQNFTKWLTSTSWSTQHLLDIAHVYGSQSLKASAPEHDTSLRLQESASQGDSPTILVPATDVGSNNSHMMPGATQKLLLPLVKTEPRRSQRIAARLQQGTQTQATEATETESQAQRLDARIAEAAKRRETKTRTRRPNPLAVKPKSSLSAIQNLELGGQPVLLHSKKRKRAGDKLSANDDLDRESHEAGLQSDHQNKKSSIKRAKRTIVREPDNQRDNNPDTAGQIEMPRTPSKRRTRATLAGISPHPLWLPPSPLNGKKAPTRIQRLDLKQSKTASVVPSPYNPQPRLVLHERIPNLRVTDLLSDSDVFLPRHDPEKMQGHKGFQVPKKRAPVKHAKKKRRLPLPPPPEIPILSTSTEENSRFNKW